MKSELKWWSDNIHSQNRIIDRGNADNSITTDAFLEGWGAVETFIISAGLHFPGICAADSQIFLSQHQFQISLDNEFHSISSVHIRISIPL
jgi:hypothetical protein